MPRVSCRHLSLQVFLLSREQQHLEISFTEDSTFFDDVSLAADEDDDDEDDEAE